MSIKKLHYGYVIIAASFLLMVVAWGTLYSFGLFFKPLLNEFGWSRTLTSLAFSTSMLLYGAFAIFVGKINDLYGPRLLVSICGLLLGSAYILMSQVTAEWQLFVIYGLMVGIGISGFFIPLTSTVARWFKLRRGIMTGLALSGTGVGVLVVPQWVSLLISSYGWRSSYIIVGLLNLILIILLAQLLVKNPASKNLSPIEDRIVEVDIKELQADSYSFQQALRMKQFWTLCVVIFFFGFILQAIMVHLVPYATDLGITDSLAAGVLATIGFASIGGRVVMGSTSDRTGSRSAVIICFSLLLISLIWLQFTNAIWMLYCFAILFGFGYGGFGPLSSLLVAELFGLRSHGIILGGTEITYTLGAAFGPALAGKIFDIRGDYHLAFLICSILSASSLTMLVLIKREEMFKSKQSDKLL